MGLPSVFSIKLLLSFLFFLGMMGELFGDGGTVQISREEGPFRITVFTTSAIVRAGPEDISVLVQNRMTHQPLLDAVVKLSFQRLEQQASIKKGETWVPPCCRMKSPHSLDGIEATHQMATNKLFYAVPVILAEAGQWEVRVEVQQTPSGTASILGNLQVEPPAPPLLAYWPFFCLPVISIAGYVLHFHLRRKKAGNAKILVENPLFLSK